MIFSSVKSHFPAIGIALAVGLLYASHHFFVSQWFLDAERFVYYPITRATYYDEAILYAPRASAAFLDWDFGGDASVYEYRHSPATLSVLGPAVFAMLGRLAGSLKAAFVLSDFIFPAAIFFLLYLLVFEMTGRRRPAMLFASAFVFFPRLGMAIPPLSSSGIQDVFAALTPFLQSSEPLHFSGFDEPKITFFFLLLAWLFLWRAFTNPSSWKDALASGISFGLLFYSYFYDWPVFVTALGLLAIFFFLTRQYDRAGQITLIAGIGALVSIPYWWNLWQVVQLPQFDELAARAGTEIGRRVRFSSVWKSYVRGAVLIAALGLWIRSRRVREWTPMHQVAAFLATYFFVVNAQVVLGINPEPDHWYRTQFLPVGLAIFLISLRVFDRFSDRVKNNLRRGLPFALVYLLASVGVSQYVSARESAEKFGVPVARAASYEWLAANTPKGSVVGAVSPALNAEIQVHTPSRIFLPYGVATIASNEELWERWMILARVFGLTSEEFAVASREGLIEYLFVGQFADRSHDAAFRPARSLLPESVLSERVGAYAARQKEPFELGRYRLEYLYVDVGHMPWGRDPALILPSLRPVYQSDAIKIYAFPGQS